MLLDLKKRIAYVGYDDLSLKCLDPLRNEVQSRIDALIERG